MMKPIFKLLAASCLASCAFVAAFGQEISVRGAIVGVLTGDPVAILVSQPTGRAIEAAIAPAKFLADRNVKFELGKKVTVIGIWRYSGKQAYVVAHRIVMDGKTVSVRSDDGHPLWTDADLTPPTYAAPETPVEGGYIEPQGGWYGDFNALGDWMYFNQGYADQLGPGILGWNNGSLVQLYGGPIILGNYGGSLIGFPLIRMYRR
jgi:hypothetical protein